MSFTTAISAPNHWAILLGLYLISLSVFLLSQISRQRILLSLWCLYNLYTYSFSFCTWKWFSFKIIGDKQICKETRNPLPTLQVTINVNTRELKKKNQPENCLVSFTLVIFKRKARLLCQFPRVAIEIYPLPNPRYSQTAEIYSVTVRKAGIWNGHVGIGAF